MEVRRRITIPVLIAATLFPPHTVSADTEGRPHLYVQSSVTDGTAFRGDRYARCFPADEEHGTPARTLIYQVKPGADVLEDTYDWYAPEVYLAGTSKGAVVVRLATGFRGRSASKDDLAVGLYLRGKPLREYSSLDLAQRPDNVSKSVSHYAWCRRVIGFAWLTAPKAKAMKFGFALETTDKRLLCFDATTGDLLDGWAPGHLHLPGD